MENAIIIYLLKASLAIVIFYGVYMLCMRNDTFFKLRRFYLLAAMLISASYPLFSLKLSVGTIERIPALISALFGLNDKGAGAGNVYVEVGEGYGTFELAPVTSSAVSVEDIVLVILLLTVSILFLRFLAQVFSIVMLRTRSSSERVGQYRIINMEEKKASSFSFFHWIFIRYDEQDDEQNGMAVIAHEMVHGRQMHSIDIIFTEIYCILFWWNPIVWLLRREVKINLEYLADKGVLDIGYNAKEYQYLLLQTTNINTGISIINNFNVSQLKRRITMINKKKTMMLFSAKYFLILPVAAGLLLSNAVKASPVIDGASEINSGIAMSADMPIESSVADPLTLDDKPFVTVEQMPAYPGGHEAMEKFIRENLKYPESAQKAGIEGRVTIRFVVSKEGDLGDIKVIRGIDPACDQEAEKVIKLMPKWIPGKQKGVAVPVYYTLPIVFNLKKETKGESTSPVHVADKKTSEKVFVTVEQMPAYPGGESAMQNFIRDNLKYPEVAQKNGIQGRVTARFIVYSDGTIKDPVVIRGISAECDAEAIRVIEAMPKWIPGKQNGKEIPVYFTLPIVYRLNKVGADKVESASYPGGQGAYTTFLAENLRYPVESQKANEVGLVIVKATILKSGEIGAASVEKSASQALDKEVVRVVKSMPRWTPEKRNGVAVDTQLSIPVVFRLKTSTGSIGDVPTDDLENVIVVVGYGVSTK